MISCLVSHLISQCSGSSVDISIDEDKITVNIDGRDFPNPCSQTECPDGMKCTVQYAPELLKVPVAHCVSAPKEETHSEGKIATTAFLLLRMIDQGHKLGGGAILDIQ